MMEPTKRDGGQPGQPEIPVIDDPKPAEPKVPDLPPPVPDPPDVVARWYRLEQRHPADGWESAWWLPRLPFRPRF
jgi:hypothetical protein